MNAGKTAAQALTPNLFTGAAGAQNLQQFTNNVTAQAGVVVANLQQAQAGLTQAGAITGKEAASAIAGPVLAAATSGLGSTLDTIKNIGSTITGAVTGAITEALGSLGGAASAVTKAIAGGNFAANLAQNLTSGLSGLASSLTSKSPIQGLTGAVDAAKGLAAGAFASVTGSFKAFKANVPVNPAKVVAENKALAEAADAASSIAGKGLNVAGLTDKVTSGLGSSLGGLTNNLGSAVADATGSLGGALGGLNAATSSIGSLTSGLSSATSAIGSLSQVTTAAGSLQGGLNFAKSAASAVSGGLSLPSVSAVSSLASGVDNLPGGASAISAIAGAKIPNADGVKSLINNSVSAVTNGISLDKSISGLADVAGKGLSVGSLTNTLSGGLASAASGGLGGLASAANGALDKLKSGQATLAGLASSGLPPGAAAALNSAMSSLGSGGTFEIKLPSVATSTNNRSDLEGKASAVLGKGIPTPNFGGKISDVATAGLSKLNESRQAKEDKLAELNAKFKDLQTELNANIKEYNDAKNTLPAGDPKLEQIKTAGIAILEKQMNLHAEMKKIEQA